MDSWAIHNLGSFARLPEDEMVARFGLEIIGLLKQARGEAFRAPNWNVKDDKFFWATDLEGAIETIEPLNFVLSKGVEQIFQNLDYAGLSTQDAKITLKGRAREKIYRIRLVFPTKNQKVWIRQIVTKIELDPPGFNIEGVGIEFRSTKPRAVQNNLYSGTVMEPENLDLIVSKLKKVVGLEKIGLPKLRDSWSEAFYMTENLSTLIEEKDRFKVRKEKFKVQSSKFKVENSGVRSQESDLSGQWSVVGGQKEQLKVQSSKFKVGNSGVSTARGSGRQSEPPAVAGGGSDEFQVPDSGVGTQYSVPSTQSETVISHQFRASFYYLPKPITARVFFESGEPKALLIKGKREMVRTAGGPWRMDAEWYKAKEWRRDEWDIETESGAVYRVFTDKNGEAFVDGGYD